jgi:hypothetical protein
MIYCLATQLSGACDRLVIKQPDAVNCFSFFWKQCSLMQLIALVSFGNSANEMLHCEGLFHSLFHLSMHDVAYGKQCSEMPY